MASCTALIILADRRSAASSIQQWYAYPVSCLVISNWYQNAVNGVQAVKRTMTNAMEKMAMATMFSHVAMRKLFVIERESRRR